MLVTGGAGFIGSHLADALLERGLNVRVLDNLTAPQKPQPTRSTGRGRYPRLDRSNPLSPASIASFIRRRCRAWGSRSNGRSRPIWSTWSARSTC